jgi:carbon storage regulator
MLVLTRKRNEMIRIGDDVVVKVIKTGKGTVKIGIEAPSNVRVLRGELAVFEETTPPATEETEVPEHELLALSSAL